MLMACILTSLTRSPKLRKETCSRRTCGKPQQAPTGRIFLIAMTHFVACRHSSSFIQASSRIDAIALALGRLGRAFKG